MSVEDRHVSALAAGLRETFPPSVPLYAVLDHAAVARSLAERLEARGVVMADAPPALPRSCTYVRPAAGEDRPHEWHAIDRVETTGGPAAGVVWVARCGRRLGHDRRLNASCGPYDFVAPPDPLCAACRG